MGGLFDGGWEVRSMFVLERFLECLVLLCISRYNNNSTILPSKTNLASDRPTKRRVYHCTEVRVEKSRPGLCLVFFLISASSLALHEPQELIYKVPANLTSWHRAI